MTYIGIGAAHSLLYDPADETAPIADPTLPKARLGHTTRPKTDQVGYHYFPKVLGTLDQRRRSTKIAFNQGPPLSDGETIARATTWMKNRRETMKFRQLSWEKILQELSIHTKGNQMPIYWHTANIYRQKRNVKACVCLNHPVSVFASLHVYKIAMIFACLAITSSILGIMAIITLIKNKEGQKQTIPNLFKD